MDRKIIEVTMQLATFALKNGHNPFTEDGEQDFDNWLGVYYYEVRLSKDRKLGVCYDSNRNKSLRRVIKKHGELEINLCSDRDDQFSIQTKDDGLTGRCDSYTIFNGKPKQEYLFDLKFSEGCNFFPMPRQIQHQYEIFLHYVAEQILGGRK